MRDTIKDSKLICLFILDKLLQLNDQSSCQVEHFFCLVLLSHLIEELDDVREVHVILNDNVTISLDKSECYEQIEVLGDDWFGCPNGLPYVEHICIEQFSLEIQQEPSIWTAMNKKSNGFNAYGVIYISRVELRNWETETYK